MAVLLVAAAWHGGWFAGAPSPPRLSLVVLPFENLSGDTKDDYLADGITDDLTTELSHIPGALVVARESAYTFKGKAVDVRTIGEELGVRYALEGSVRRLGSTLRINVQLVSAETGVHLWSDRFDEQISELSAGQEQIVARMRDELGISMVEIENARSLRERPTNPDAFDLILRARSLAHLPAESATGQGGVGAVRARPRAGPGIGLCHDQHCVFPVHRRPGRRLGHFREHAARCAPAGRGTCNRT